MISLELGDLRKVVVLHDVLVQRGPAMRSSGQTFCRNVHRGDGLPNVHVSDDYVERWSY